jgi:hypothetical protein
MLTKHHAMNMYGRVEVQLHRFLMSVQDGGGQLHTLDWTGLVQDVV